MLQGDRVEPPEYIVDNNTEIDVLSYIEHVKKPITQLLDLIVDDPSALFEPYEIEETIKRYNFQPLKQPRLTDEVLKESLKRGLKQVGNMPEIRAFFDGYEELFDDKTHFATNITKHFDKFMQKYLKSTSETKNIKKAICPILDAVVDNSNAMFKPYELQALNKSSGLRQLAYGTAPKAKLLVHQKATPLSPAAIKVVSVQTTLKWLNMGR